MTCKYEVIELLRRTNVPITTPYQLNYYAVPVLVDEKPRNVIIHIDSNDITKMNYENVNAEYLAQRIVSISKKCRPFGVEKIAILTICIRKNAKFNKIIEEVNYLISNVI